MGSGASTLSDVRVGTTGVPRFLRKKAPMWATSGPTLFSSVRTHDRKNAMQERSLVNHSACGCERNLGAMASRDHCGRAWPTAWAFHRSASAVKWSATNLNIRKITKRQRPSEGQERRPGLRDPCCYRNWCSGFEVQRRTTNNQNRRKNSALPYSASVCEILREEVRTTEPMPKRGVGARKGTRTPTPFRASGPKPGASTNFAILATRGCRHWVRRHPGIGSTAHVVR